MKKSKIRAFNDEGIKRFKNQLNSEIESKSTTDRWRRNASEWEFIFDDKFAPEFMENIELEQIEFVSRFEMGRYLDNKIEVKDLTTFRNGSLLNWISAFYFSNISGKKKAPESYFFENRYDSYYRHFIRSCWYLYHTLGEDSEWLLLGKTSIWPDIIEQVTSKQYVIENKKEIIKTAQRLYCITDENGILTHRHKEKINSKRAGDIRRFTSIWLRQIQKNYYINNLSSDEIFALLPKGDEFDHWIGKQNDLFLNANSNN